MCSGNLDILITFERSHLLTLVYAFLMLLNQKSMFISVHGALTNIKLSVTSGLRGRHRKNDSSFFIYYKLKEVSNRKF